MRKILLMACALAVVVMAGCGGGGGSTSAITPTAQITLPSGVTASSSDTAVEYRTASQLPSAPSGRAFVAGAVCTPEGTTFTGGHAVLTFTLASPLEQGATVTLFKADIDGNWTNVTGTNVVVSSDRMSLTVEVSSFSGKGYAIFKS